ncbi:MAG: hypothetical protein LCH61_11750 [Proteobacteria bacterium]|nr:hypothetical protein [Pseudomonadota bacterium]
MNVAQFLVALLLGGQVLWAMFQGVTVFTPACADHAARLNDQFNSAILFAALLALGGFWSTRHD